MSDDLVRAEISAVRTLKHGVERYAQQIRDALGQARREVATADQKAQKAVERRRSEVQKRDHELRQAEAALRQCQENCRGLEQQAAAAAQKLAEAKQLLHRARRAAQMTAAAQSELLKVLHGTEATVAEHSSVASGALSNLDAKLAELPKYGVRRAIHNLAVGTAVGVEILGATVDLSPPVGNALQAVGVRNPLADPSITEMAERQRGQERDYVIERNFEASKERKPGERRETEA